MSFNYIKSFLSKINFAIGKNPGIERTPNWQKYIPDPYKAVVTLTADFELAWAWRYDKYGSPMDITLKRAHKERENIPKILALCEKYDIPITWATVGHLFLESCNGKHEEIPSIPAYEGPYWNFNGNNWFEFDPGTNYKRNPEWYAPDLIKQILESKVEHEIGCHTFSHIDCREEVCTTILFEAEINACKQAASKYNLNLKSFVHPGHTIGHLDKLPELEFTSFQSDPGNILGYPVKHPNGLWELKRTYEFVWRKEWSADYHIYRYKKIIDRAIQNHSVCNFWFHPSFDKNNIKILEEVFKYINSKNNLLLITTVNKYINMIKYISHA